MTPAVHLDSTASRNALLAPLPAVEADRMLELGEVVDLLQGQVLGEVGAELQFVYFPHDCAIAELSEGGNKQSLAVGLVGREGMLGATMLLGRRQWSLRAQVQGTGRALRLGVDDLRRALDGAPVLRATLMAYLDVLQAQYARVAACASFHVLEMRLAWWLLLSHDRVRGDRFELTHDAIARMLGVRRSGVTRAAGNLQDTRIISYTRGRLLVLDRRRLEHASCSCYALMRTAHRRLERARTAPVTDGSTKPPVRPNVAPRRIGLRPDKVEDLQPAPPA